MKSAAGDALFQYDLRALYGRRRDIAVQTDLQPGTVGKNYMQHDGARD